MQDCLGDESLENLAVMSLGMSLGMSLVGLEGPAVNSDIMGHEDLAGIGLCMILLISRGSGN